MLPKLIYIVEFNTKERERERYVHFSQTIVQSCKTKPKALKKKKIKKQDRENTDYGLKLKTTQHTLSF